MRGPSKTFLALLLAGGLSASLTARAQSRAFSGTNLWDLHPTDVLDAADGEDPYDFDLDVMFDMSLESASIQREYNCNNTGLYYYNENPLPGDPNFTQNSADADGNCGPKDSRIVPAREMDYERIRQRLNVLARFGIWHDLEFHVWLPIVLADKTTLSMAKKSDKPGSRELRPYCADPSCSQSSVYRETGPEPNGLPDLKHSFFRLPNKGLQRAGLDNPTLGLWWAPFNDERDDTVATWRLGVDYTLNIVDRLNATDKDRVGQGYDELRLSMAMSRRYTVMRPYLEFAYSISNLIEDPQKPPFVDFGNGQTLIEPGDRASLRFGSEVIPWENPKKGQWFALDFGGEFIYQFEGRDYTPLFSALSTSQCNSNPDCVLTRRNGTDKLPLNEHDGITDVEQFGVLRGWLGFSVQAARMVRFQARAVLAHQLPHFLTFADAGKDDSSVSTADREVGIIDPNTTEENPVFNQNTDLAGSRFRSASHLDFGFFLTGVMTF